MLIAIINESSLVSNADVEVMCAACQVQNTQHCAPAWNQMPATITFFADKTKVPADAWLISIIDSEADVSGALGFHSVDTTDDRVVGYIMCQPVLSNNGVPLYDPANPQNTSVASVLSHEVCEAFIDPFCSYWAQGKPIEAGSEYALESADACEDVSYVIEVSGQKVAVSDFLFPEFFNSNWLISQEKQLDYCKKIAAPFTMTPGGYMVVRNGPGSEQQIFGEMMPQWKKEMKSKSKSRRFNRRQEEKLNWLERLLEWFDF